jgi:RNA polymerase sigma factor (sigma-70 family)
VKIRLLLADDHAVMRDGLAALFAGDLGVEVLALAEDGHQAVRLAREHRPDVVVMDMAMPRLNGLEAAKQIREHLPATRILMLSMHSTLEHIQQAFNAGATGYVLKESAVAEIRSAIEQVHAGRTFLGRQLQRHANALLSADRDTALERLSRRERQILQLVVEGRSSSQIGASLRLSQKTVESYRSRLMKKLEVDGVAALVKFAVSRGLTPSA